MKKFTILAGILLLPLLATAYDFGPEYSAMAESTAKAITSAIARFDDGNLLTTRKDKIEKIKIIIKTSQKNFTGKEGDVLVTSKYYDIDEIKANLAEEGLDTFLASDAAALEEIADYITQHFIVNAYNDFETLYTVGVNPIEAAIRSGHDDYVTSALNDQIIIYKHYSSTIDTDTFGGRFVNGKIEDKQIDVVTSEEEIEAIKTKLQKKSFWDKLAVVFEKIDKVIAKMSGSFVSEMATSFIAGSQSMK